MLQYIVVIGAVVNIAGVFSYIRDTLRGKTKPNRVSWAFWSIVPMIASVAAFSKGAGWAALPIFMSGFVPLLVFISSFRNPQAYWKLRKIDYLCGLFAFITLLLWVFTKKPEVAIMFAILSDALAAAPTVVKAWKYPETESGVVYVTGAFNALTTFFAVQTWIFAAYGFSVYLVIANGLLTYVVYRKKFNLKKVKAE